jgi:hypothetical protein
MSINTWAIESKRGLPAGTCSAYHVSAGKLPLVVIVRAWVTEGKKTRLYRNGNCGIVRRFHCRSVEELEEVVRYTDKLNRGTRWQSCRPDRAVMNSANPPVTSHQPPKTLRTLRWFVAVNRAKLALWTGTAIPAHS